MKKSFTLPLLVSAFIFLQPGKIKAQVNVRDSLALVDLYNSTDGPHWKNNTNWLTSNPVSTWYGILRSQLKIEQITLANNNLTGKIPANIGDLTGLSFGLDLSNNHLTGSIPGTIGDLPKLFRLDLSHNKLTGEIPPEIGNIYTLGYLDLSNNRLSGSISSEIGKIYGYYGIKLNNNKLSGNIPTELGYHSALITLDLSNNQLSGSIPAQFFKIFINHLNLSSNQLS